MGAGNDEKRLGASLCLALAHGVEGRAGLEPVDLVIVEGLVHWELVRLPIRLLADHCERLARLEVCQALDADSVEWANLRERKGCQLSNPVCSMPSIIIHAGADCAGRQADGRYKTLSVLSAWIVDSITAPAGEAPLLSSC